MLVNHQAKVGGTQSDEPFVLEADVEQPLSGRAALQAVGQDLPEKACFPGTPHANDSDGLPATDGSQTSRLVSVGGAVAMLSMIFCRIRERYRSSMETDFG